MLELDQLNIDNLTSLWKKMGVETHSTLAKNGVNISRTWPYRYWLDWNATAEQECALNASLHSLPAQAVIPVWAGGEKGAAALENVLLANGYRILFSQLAMVLDLQSVAATDLPEVDVVTVTSTVATEIWTETASAAFGYQIDSAAIHALATDPAVTLLLVKKMHQPAATALLYKTGAVLGVHLVGVSDRYRGQGIARALMQYVIQFSIDVGGKYLTLQASAAGEPLYRQLGFVEQFLMKNYHRVS